jgi:hypothetical protein
MVGILKNDVAVGDVTAVDTWGFVFGAFYVILAVSLCCMSYGRKHSQCEHQYFDHFVAHIL